MKIIIVEFVIAFLLGQFAPDSFLDKYAIDISYAMAVIATIVIIYNIAVFFFKTFPEWECKKINESIKKQNEKEYHYAGIITNSDGTQQHKWVSDNGAKYKNV
jgi:hypothetical protein